MRLTEPLRDEHADLLPHIAELDAVAAGLDDGRRTPRYVWTASSSSSAVISSACVS